MKERKAAEHEVSVLTRLKHPNIVQYVEAFWDGSTLCIVMAFCAGGDLAGRIEKAAKIRRRFDEKTILNWFVQLTLALDTLHDQRILHRDLKAQNVFLTGADVVKLGDFGIARVLSSSVDLASTVIGTPYYMSPELFERRPYASKSDIWALGCVLYEMMALRHPFDATSMQGLAAKVIRGSYTPPPNQYSTKLRAICDRMLNQNPRIRPSTRSILRSSFIKDHMASLAGAPSTGPSQPLQRSRSRGRVSTSSVGKPEPARAAVSRKPSGGGAMAPSARSRASSASGSRKSAGTRVEALSKVRARKVQELAQAEEAKAMVEVALKKLNTKKTKVGKTGAKPARGPTSPSSPSTVSSPESAPPAIPSATSPEPPIGAAPTQGPSSAEQVLARAQARAQARAAAQKGDFPVMSAQGPQSAVELSTELARKSAAIEVLRASLVETDIELNEVNREVVEAAERRSLESILRDKVGMSSDGSLMRPTNPSGGLDDEEGSEYEGSDEEDWGDEDDDGGNTPESSLQAGRLSDRAEALKKHCVDKIGVSGFDQLYAAVKSGTGEDLSKFHEAECVDLVEQLVFLEAAL